MYRLFWARAGLMLLGMTGPALADQVINDDLIVTFSLCVGISCVDNEDFGVDTIRLKHNNVRIHFEDTSSFEGFPSNDWRIVANDNFDGGTNYFAVEDSTASRIPFRIEAGARANALYVEANGEVGFGTNEPEWPLHVVDGNTPTLRLEQDETEAYPAQVWDIGGNENFFAVSDRTTDTLHPFKIKPGAPTDALVIEANGDIGLGTDIPNAPLDIRRDDGTARIQVVDFSTTQAVREMFRMENYGGSYFTLANGATGKAWYFTHENNAPNRFIITSDANPSRGLFLGSDGNMRIGGVLTQNSDKTTKMAIEPVDPADVLSKLNALELSEWSYKIDDSGARHMGPMAQDFHALFGLGATETGISTIDTSGVALAAIQALSAENAALRADMAALRAEVARLTE